MELRVGLGLMVPEEGPVLQAKCPAQSQRKPSQAPGPGEDPEAPASLAVGRAVQNVDWKVLEINNHRCRGSGGDPGSVLREPLF